MPHLVKCHGNSGAYAQSRNSSTRSSLSTDIHYSDKCCQSKKLSRVICWHADYMFINRKRASVDKVRLQQYGLKLSVKKTECIELGSETKDLVNVNETLRNVKSLKFLKQQILSEVIA